MSESATGITSIRAFNAQNFFIKEYNKRIDINTNINYLISSANRWLGIWTSFLNSIILFSACILVITNFGTISAGMAGFLLTNCIKIVNSLTFAIRSYVRIENNFISIKRVKEYIGLDSEFHSYERLTKCKPREIEWPTVGSIEFRDFKASYNKDSMNFALLGINLTFNGGEKIGIVGRTGSGIKIYTFKSRTRTRIFA
jgi:ATP-binding cassette subfamily C (CFTR/MRP) protein 1